MVLAIDFGTSNTVLCRWNAATQSSEVLALNTVSQRTSGPAVVPSLLYVEDAQQNQVLIGQPVRDRGLDRSDRCFKNFKRGIGTSIQGFLPDLDGCTLSFEQVGEWFLTQVIDQVKQQEEGLDELVLTVPVDSFETYRSWLGTLCQRWDISRVRMIDEPTAAALGYGITDNKTVLVIDFGGGTLDLATVQLSGRRSQALGYILKWGQKSMGNSAQQVSTAKVLAKAGENLGGADIDQWVAQYLCDQHGLPMSSLILRLAEQLKIQLSATPSANESYFDDETFESYDLTLTREQFDAILQQQGFFERLDERLTQVLQQGRRQGVDVADIDAVLLVGGTTQIPAIQSWIHTQFDGTKVCCDRPFTAVSSGALQLQQVKLTDFLYHGYGIRFWDRRNNCHGWHSIIPQGQAYPMIQPVELVLGASTEKQPSIELIIGELGSEQGSTEVYFEGNRLVTRRAKAGQAAAQSLNEKAPNIATLTPPGMPGEDRIRLSFTVDQDRLLKVTVEDLLTEEVLAKNQAVVELS
ncbi:Hsp70 family protein [Leptothoe spongobia]|uniref:Hsp70 family protein n=1 Tax=Leptothoe spongobia TAU-MAC 1115 TaxID=1967444 RepID=A0A947GJX5_9CYAN|nr:Hsp70 family protein [Leptothoe spongobia]MBT9316363.1 Hsp70 family protein [Leptothoe spongobia TAU-MAC 1115]